MTQSTKPSHRTGLALIAALVLAALTLGACSAASATDNEADMTTETGTVAQTTYVDTYETTGSLAAKNKTAVVWTTTGTVQEVLVALGQAVKAGDALMTIDPASVSAALDAAQAEVDKADEALKSLLAPDAATVTTAERALTSAVSAWRDARAALTSQLKRYSSAGDYDLYLVWLDADEALTDAMNGLNLASASLDVQMAFQAGRAVTLAQAADAQAQTALSAAPDDAALKQRTDEMKAALTAAETEAETRRTALSETEQTNLLTLLSALSGYDGALDVFVASFDDDTAFEYAARITSLQAAYNDAAVKLDGATLGLYTLVRAPDADAYAAAVERLATAGEKLQDLTDSLTLRAPVDGEVVSLNFEAGDEAKPNPAAVELLDRKNLYLTLAIEESRIIKLSVGDPVVLSIEVLPEVALTGHVAYINPVGSASQGVVYYTVRVDIDQPDSDVLIGATADVAIQLGEPRDVFTVPVLAVQNDTTGEYVYRVVNGQYERVAVVSGLILADDTVVVEGNLAVGDTVAIFSDTSSGNSQEGVFPGMGGGAVIRP